MQQVSAFQTTFDDIFNAIFNSYPTNNSDYAEIKVPISSVKDDALNRFELYCLERKIDFERVALGENLILLKVNRHFK